ncbi:hypothetical protein ACHAP7_000863 [Fusarium lateritium]
MGLQQLRGSSSAVIAANGLMEIGQLTPGNAELLAHPKELWDEHSDVWDHETKESLIRYICQGDTDITKTNIETPSGHKLWRTPISFAIWTIFRVQYDQRKLPLMKSRMLEKFPGIDLSSWKSPGFKKPRVKCPLVGRKDPPATQNQSKDDGDLGLNANPFTELVGHDDDEEDPHMSDFSDSELEGSDQDEDENDTPVHSRIQQAFAFSSRKRSGSSSSHRQKAKQPRTSSSPPPVRRFKRRQPVASPTPRSTPSISGSQRNSSPSARTSSGKRPLSSTERLRQRQAGRRSPSSAPRKIPGKLTTDHQAAKTPDHSTRKHGDRFVNPSIKEECLLGRTMHWHATHLYDIFDIRKRLFKNQP